MPIRKDCILFDSNHATLEKANYGHRARDGSVAKVHILIPEDNSQHPHQAAQNHLQLQLQDIPHSLATVGTYNHMHIPTERHIIKNN